MRVEELERALKAACQKLFQAEIEPEITRPDEQFGDYSTNVALQLAKKAAATPRQIAQQLVDELQNLDGIKDVSIAGPGFINFTLTDEALQTAAASAAELPKPRDGQEILVEFGDPNPFKEMHIGHVYSAITGESIARLLVASGAIVQSLSYHGDVGLHVAKAIWGIGKKIDWNADRLKELDFAKAYQNERGLVIEWDKSIVGQLYADGAKAYDSDKKIAADIDAINGHVYKRDNDLINQIYEWGCHQSFEYFGRIWRILGIRYEKRYLESKTSKTGIETVKDHIGTVFEKSEGAVVYKGEKQGLHTRVFITSKGLPTYETKDLGLAIQKNRDFPDAAKSVIITAHEQSEYFKVMLAALAEINPLIASKTFHISHGFVNLSTGKMSSRTGDVYGAYDLLVTVREAVKKQFTTLSEDQISSVSEGAINYALLKSRTGSDITFDIEESINLEGNSGPYLQYAHARAWSILDKSGFQMPYTVDSQGIEHEEPLKLDLNGESFDDSERSLARKISEYPEVVTKAVNELMPHHICTYLYELAQTFNSFYEKSRIIGDRRESLRLGLVKSYSQVLKRGLNILNIDAPNRM